VELAQAIVANSYWIAPWRLENVITLGGGKWWGFGGTPNTDSYEGWLTQLLNAYNVGLGLKPDLSDAQKALVDGALKDPPQVPAGKSFGFDGGASFWDMAKIGQQIFDKKLFK
jgi:hypothetical protein